MARHARLLRHQGHLDQVGERGTEQNVMSDFADPRELALSDVGDPARGIGLDHRPHLLESIRGA
jgi:hypothetical protein